LNLLGIRSRIVSIPEGMAAAAANKQVPSIAEGNGPGNARRVCRAVVGLIHFCDNLTGL